LWAVLCGAVWAGNGALAQPVRTPAPVAVNPAALPPELRTVWQQTGLPAEALALWVADARPGGQVWWQHQGTQPFNPASVMKLVTTFAALDMLGPAHVWRTEVLTDGPVRDGVLQGHLYLRGGGDPKLVTERLWALLRRVQGLGINRVAGDIVLDRSAYHLPPSDPAAFDGEPLRPYNVSADAWLVNYNALQLHWEPDAIAGVAHLFVDPPLADMVLPRSVPLKTDPGKECGDWRAGLQIDFNDPLRPVFRGSYPLACGARSWPLAPPQPERFAERAVAGLWQQLDGRLDGVVRPGQTPSTATPRLVWESPPLAEVARDVNKYSNNVMAQHLLLALAPHEPTATDPARSQPATFEAAQAVLSDWWTRRIGPDQARPEVGLGSGLSRDGRISAAAMARLLQVAYVSPNMPDLMASLPLAGTDGTLRRSQSMAGLAHLKTGSLRDVQAVAGYVHGPQGERRVLVAMVNHPNARAARPLFEALVQWVAERPATTVR